ncbi:hypothetical protein L0U85_17950 [Glycomyces sp. L485]|uniref:hypothetical protein n=1 Tax=Glycomyces sp. L485 TaxID=2909235 RepID=UPI001F4A5D50|nr:hypothetical protein [Glycomyces sp. L485]MCH7232720.1 hypothetical protein [Glycomyces sp. L485]
MADPSTLQSLPQDLLDEPASAALESLIDDDPVPLADYLETNGVEVDRLWELPRWNAESERTPTRRRDAADDARRMKVLRQDMLEVIDRPAGAALLGLHVWYLCSEAWEHTYQFDRLIGTLEAFASTWKLLRLNDPDERSRAAGDAAALLADSLAREIDVESALCRGEFTRHAQATAEAVQVSEQLIESSGRIGDELARLREYFLELAGARATYYRSVLAAIEASQAVLTGEGDAAAGIAALRQAENSPDLSHIERSELRAHRFSLERIAAASDDEWLTVDHAKLVYLFPFGVNGLQPESAVELVRAMNSPPKIAGIDARSVRQSFELDDVWAGSGHLDRRFEGAAIELPPVTLRHADGEEIAELTAEVRVSQLGNHYLRLETEIFDCDPHQVQFALFRAASEHAAIDVSCGDHESAWDRLAEFADAVQSGVADMLAARARATVEARAGRYHVLVSVHEASAGRGPATPADRRRPVESGDDLLGLFGSQALLHPVPNGIGSICDWARLAVDERRLLRNVRKDGDLVAATANTTVTALFGSPSFIIGMFETVAEFVGSLGGLFSAWHHRLAGHRPRVMSLVEGRADEDSAEALSAYAERLRREQLALHDFATEVRSVLSLIRSPNLMTSPTDAETLVLLVRAAEVERQELEFATKLRELLSDRLEVRLDALAGKLQRRRDADHERRERFSRSMMEALLGAIAVFGIAGIVQILQTAGQNGEGFAWSAVWGICALAVVLSASVFFLSWRAWKPRD